MIEEVLKERASRYGTFEDHAEIAQGLQEVLWDCPNWHKMPLDARQALIVITDKMARMLNGDASYDDNWVDIIGYATLVLNRIRDDERNKAEQERLSKLIDEAKNELVSPLTEKNMPYTSVTAPFQTGTLVSTTGLFPPSNEANWTFCETAEKIAMLFDPEDSCKG